jgi:hypothetical protein
MRAKNRVEGARASFPCPEDITGDARTKQQVSERLYRASLYCGTGEVVVVQEPAVSPCEPGRLDRDRRPGSRTSPEQSDVRPEVQVRNKERAQRRARSRVRRYCVANQLSRLWTLTYADAEWDVEHVKRDVNEFVRALRAELKRSLAYVVVLELHPEGHGIHVHLVLEAMFVNKTRLQEIWGHGLVQYSDRKSGHSRGGRERARMAAGYVSKYLGKDLGWVGVGRHRYEVAEGFAVRVERSPAVTWPELCELVEALTGGVAPYRSWSSRQSPDFTGPPCWWLVWPGLA